MSVARFDLLKINEYRSLDELLELQESLRRDIVRAAMTQSPFYKNHYCAVGFESGDIGKEGWFERLPVVTKKELREHFKEWRCRADRRRR